jgi:hypothetical protein
MEPSETRRTLFEISTDLLALYDRIEELGGDVTAPDVEQAIDAWFERLSHERDEKLDNYAALIRELEARAQARRDEAKRLADRARKVGTVCIGSTGSGLTPDFRRWSVL